ncbi:MAG: flagellar biosynthetic protein FliP, partial [Sulfurihydrogenibium sp.]|nr:flagellar biosynthetic protein FliP [Sulfurihydrogenibium sp.]
MGIFIEPKQKSLELRPLYDKRGEKIRSKRCTFLKPAKILLPLHYYIIIITDKITLCSEVRKQSYNILSFSLSTYFTIFIIIVLTLLNFSFSYADTLSETLAGFNRLDTTLKILLLITIISIAPALLISVTAFVRIVIVLSLLRHALGIPTAPPNQVIVGLALF